MKKILVAVAVLVVIAAVVLFRSPLRSKPGTTGTPADVAGVSAEPGGAQTGVAASAMVTGAGAKSNSTRTSGAPTLDDLVEGSSTIGEAIAKARVSFGKNDPRVAELMGMADAICSEPPDPTDATNPKHPDPTRSWAVSRLMTLCEGYEPGQNGHFDDGRPDLSQIYSKQGKEAAVFEAQRVLRTANDYDSLYSAGQILLETGAIPLDQILPGHQYRYGPADLIPAWAMASQLMGCSGASACGPDSLQTAAFCAHAGCVQGVTFEQALTQELPPSQLRAVMAFRQWMLAQRQESP